MSSELLRNLQDTAALPEANYTPPIPSDNGPPNIYDRIAMLQAEAKEFKAAGKPMSARKKLDEARHYRRLVKKIEKYSKDLV